MANAYSLMVEKIPHEVDLLFAHPLQSPLSPPGLAAGLLCLLGKFPPPFSSNRCAAHLKLADGILALADADTCLKLKPNWAKGHMRQGSSFVLLQQFDEAASAFTRAAELEPGNRECEACTHARASFQHIRHP